MFFVVVEMDGVLKSQATWSRIQDDDLSIFQSNFFFFALLCLFVLFLVASYVQIP